jgi:hypothetical protein
MYIQHFFSDWTRAGARQNPRYPQSQILELKLNLLSVRETETWLRNKIREIRENVSLDEDEVVPCPESDLWRSETQYKYYADPETARKGGRSTKNFDNRQAALLHQTQAGKGTVVTVPGVVRACGYCPAFTICTQKDQYEHA